MKIVSFNIRYENEWDGPNGFEFRKELILDKIRREKPDVIGFQEVLPHVQDWLNASLPEYAVAGCGRETDYSDEHMTLALRRETAQLFSLEVFWLSPTPRIPGSRYLKQSICPRTCAAALVKLKGMESPIRIYDTHLDHEGADARELGLTQVLARMEEDQRIRRLPAVLLGDFNAEPDAPELAGLASSPLELSDAASGLGHTFHGFGNPSVFCKIDYLLYTKDFTCRKAELWKEEKDRYLSDHYPVCAELDLA